MAEKLKGKVAVVTASTSGIGLAIAKKLARDGASVVISSRKKENVDRAVKEVTSEGGKAYGLVCDVTKQEDRARLVNMTRAFYGKIDILVPTAAAKPEYTPILETTTSNWDKAFDVNLKTTFFLCKEVIPMMKAKGGGNIVFVSSLGGYNPGELDGAHDISKAALIGLTKAMVSQCAGMNIRVNAIAPGVMKTAFSEPLWSDEGTKERLLNQTPLNRLGQPGDCAGAVSFLVSDDASYITGETIVIGGGRSARL